MNAELMELGHVDVDDDAPVVRLRSAQEIAATVTTALWLIGHVFEAFAIAIMFGDLGTFKSFLALDWSLHIAAGRKWLDKFAVKEAANVVYIHAEGRGLGKRIRGWCIHHGVDVASLKFHAVEHLLDLSGDGLANLIEAIDKLGIRPALIVIDTLSRNCGPLDEDRSKDMAPFINRLDAALRVRYGASVLLVHHTGHSAKDRTRGTYVLLANTDSNYRVERPNPEEQIIKISVGRLKDSESPEPIYIMGKVVDLGTLDSEGTRESTIVLVPTHSRPVEARKAPTGRQQKDLLANLERQATADESRAVWTEGELREIARGIGMSKSTARSAVHGLRTLGYLSPTIGGSRLAFVPGQTKGRRDENGTKCTIRPRSVGDEKDESPIGLVPSSLTSPPTSPPGGHSEQSPSNPALSSEQAPSNAPCLPQKQGALRRE